MHEKIQLKHYKIAWFNINLIIQLFLPNHLIYNSRLITRRLIPSVLLLFISNVILNIHAQKIQLKNHTTFKPLLKAKIKSIFLNIK